MWKCTACGTYGKSPVNFTHGPTCAALDDSQLVASAHPNSDHEERRTRAMERQADAVQHAATSLADFAVALNTFGPVLRMLAAEMEADLKNRGRKPFA